jgi:hypothetical protein
MAEKGMIVENPLELLPLFEGMQLLPDASFLPSESRIKQEIEAPAQNHQEAAQTSVEQPIDIPASEPKSEEPGPLIAETWILNVWVDESKKHWPEEFRAPLTALLSAIKMEGQAVEMEKVQVLNPFVFTDRHGIKEWALNLKPKSILIWANQTNLDDVPPVFEQTQWEGVPVFRLPAFSKVAAHVDNKREAWGKLKGFYQF